MATDPAFLLYSKDWLEGTAEMSAAEKGVYIDLLCFQHQRGFIPEDTKRIATLVGMKEDDFLNHWEYIKGKFTLAEPGKLTNKKLLRVAGERSEHSKMRTILGTFGGQLRALKTAEKNKEKLRKLFNYKEFLGTPISELASCLAIWLAKSQANTKQIIEDGDGIEDEIGIEDEDLLNKYKEWLNLRDVSDVAKKRQVNLLKKYPSETAIAMIEQSITNDWTGLFPIKGKPTNTPNAIGEAIVPK